MRAMRGEPRCGNTGIDLTCKQALVPAPRWRLHDKHSQILIDQVQMKSVVQVFSRLDANRARNLLASVQPRALRAAVKIFRCANPFPRSLR